MSGPLRPVPDLPDENREPTVTRRGFAQLLPQPVGKPPAAAPLDEVSRARLRRILIEQFGEFPTLDLHLALLDSRGAWYAELAIGSWSADHPDGFFGLVRHVVRTQIPGPPPDPDLEAWLMAGRPTDPMLAGYWSTLRHFLPASRDVAESARRAAQPTPAVQRVDEILDSWPADLFDRFYHAYAKIENVLMRRTIVIPPIGQ